MDTRVDHIIIGKDVARTVTTLGTSSSSSNLLDGEIVVLDKDMKLLSLANANKTDNPTIYVAVGLSTTFYNPGQTTYSKRNMRISPPITNPVSYTKYAYAAETQTASRFGTITGVAKATEYALRVFYTDPHMTHQTNGQFVQEWRSADRGTTGASYMVHDLVTKVNADANSRVSAAAAAGGTGLTVTAKALTGETLNDNLEHYQVNFDAYFFAVDSNGNKTQTHYAAQTNTNISYGKGTWQQMRDAERNAKSNEGNMNPLAWPQHTMETSWLTVENANYSQIVLEYNKPFVSSDTNYIKDTHETLVIAAPYSANNQLDDVIGILNSWMNSWGIASISNF